MIRRLLCDLFRILERSLYTHIYNKIENRETTWRFTNSENHWRSFRFQTVKIKIRKVSLNILFIDQLFQKVWEILQTIGSTLPSSPNKFPFDFLRSIYLESRNIILDACRREHNSRRIPKHAFECIFPRMCASHVFRVAEARIKRLDTNGSIRIERAANERHPLVKRCLATAHVSHSSARKRNACSLDRQYITPVITVKPASITIKRQMHG